MVNNNTLFFMFNLCNPKPGQGLEVGVYNITLMYCNRLYYHQG